MPHETRLSRATAAALVPSVVVSCTRLVAPLQHVGAAPTSGPAAAPEGPEVSILVYHRFGPWVKDAMTVWTATFRWQLDYLKQHGYTIIPLRALISYLSGHALAPPPRDLLTHYSGLKPDLSLKSRWSGYQTAMNMLAAERPLHAARTQYVYSDENFAVLGDLFVRVPPTRSSP